MADHIYLGNVYKNAKNIQVEVSFVKLLYGPRPQDICREIEFKSPNIGKESPGFFKVTLTNEHDWAEIKVGDKFEMTLRLL